MKVDKWKDCPVCKGSGVGPERDTSEEAGEPDSITAVCRTCGGKGKVPDLEVEKD